MNKQELIEAMRNKSGLPKADCESALNAYIETVSDALAKGEKVTLIGFGTLAAVMRKGREGRNPKTGATVTIPTRRVAKFTPGVTLRERVAGA